MPNKEWSDEQKCKMAWFLEKGIFSSQPVVRMLSALTPEAVKIRNSGVDVQMEAGIELGDTDTAKMILDFLDSTGLDLEDFFLYFNYGHRLHASQVMGWALLENAMNNGEITDVLHSRGAIRNQKIQ